MKQLDSHDQRQLARIIFLWLEVQISAMRCLSYRQVCEVGRDDGSVLLLRKHMVNAIGVTSLEPVDNVCS
jgi:hypothetical protein